VRPNAQTSAGPNTAALLATTIWSRPDRANFNATATATKPTSMTTPNPARAANFGAVSPLDL
jgi:hypothetical protein